MQRTSNYRVIQVFVLLAMLGLALGLWRQHAHIERIRQENERLRQQNDALQQVPAQAAEEPPAATPAPSAPAEEQSAAETTAAQSAVAVPAPRTSGLELAGTEVTPVDGGLRATMRFTTATTDPLGVVAVVVRLPLQSEGRILDFGAAGSATFAEVTHRVAENGKFAVFQGTVESVKQLEFALTVSGADVAEVRGTCGIGPFDLSIDPSGASAHPK